MQGVINAINSNNQSAFTAQIFSTSNGLIKVISKEQGTVNDGSFVNVSTSSGAISAMIRPMVGGSNPVCYTVIQSKLDEHVIYADSRLGVIKHGGKVLNTNFNSNAKQFTNVAGKRMYELKNWLGSVISVVRDLKYWTKQDGQSTKVEYNTSFEGGDELMFHANIDAEYTKSSTQVAEGNYSLYLNAQTDNRSHYGPNIIHQFVQTGDKLLIDLKAFYQGNTSGWNNSQGGRWVYELQNEQGGNLYESNGTTRQWRAISITGNANSWNNYSVNFTIPQTYNADGTPYTGKIRIHSYAWVSPVHNPTYFDEFKMQILPHDYVAPTNQNYYFSAVIEMSADYHEFGQTMEGRGFVGSLNYRYGYQGSEKDNEVNSSNGTSYTTEFRQLDTRLGRWFSSDPVFQPWQSSYTSMDNDPVNLTDVMGDVAGDGPRAHSVPKAHQSGNSGNSKNSYSPARQKVKQTEAKNPKSKSKNTNNKSNSNTSSKEQKSSNYQKEIDNTVSNNGNPIKQYGWTCGVSAISKLFAELNPEEYEAAVKGLIDEGKYKVKNGGMIKANDKINEAIQNDDKGSWSRFTDMVMVGALRSTFNTRHKFDPQGNSNIVDGTLPNEVRRILRKVGLKVGHYEYYTKETEKDFKRIKTAIDNEQEVLLFVAYEHWQTSDPEKEVNKDAKEDGKLYNSAVHGIHYVVLNEITYDSQTDTYTLKVWDYGQVNSLRTFEAKGLEKLQSGLKGYWVVEGLRK